MRSELGKALPNRRFPIDPAHRAMMALTDIDVDKDVNGVMTAFVGQRDLPRIDRSIPANDHGAGPAPRYQAAFKHQGAEP